MSNDSCVICGRLFLPGYEGEVCEVCVKNDKQTADVWKIVKGVKPRRAMNNYSCDNCAADIPKGSQYWRFDLIRKALHAESEGCLFSLLKKEGIA